MKVSLSFLTILIHVAAFARANVYPRGSVVGYICKTAFENITFECEDEKTCICTESKRRSFVYCAMTHTSNEKELTDAFETLERPCPDISSSVLQNDTVFAPSEVRKVTYEDLHDKNITYPIIVPQENYNFSDKCVSASFYHLKICDEMAGGMVAFWALVLLIQMVLNFIQFYFPRFMNAIDTGLTRSIRKFFILPATFGYKHTSISSLLGYQWMIPTRMETLVVIGHSIINIVLSCTNYPLIQGSWYKNPEIDKQLQSYLAWRSGVFAIVHIPLMYLFAGRNNFLMWLTGWPIDRFNLFHRWLARWMMIHTIIHAVAYAIDFSGTPVLGIMWLEPFWRHGFAATIFGAVLIVHSVYYLRSHFYELFLITHIILAVAFTITCYYHVFYLSGGTQYMWASVAVWGFDRLSRIARIIISGVNSKAETKLYPDGVIKMTIKYSRVWKFKAGQYLFIHVMRWKYFYQSHPFSVIQSPLPKDEGKLILLFKVRNGFTKQMLEELEMQHSRCINYRLLIDGPYGEEKPVHNYDNVVLVAGGIGVTGVYGYAAELLAKKRHNRICLNWCVADENALEWFQDELEYLSQDDRFDVRVYIKSLSQMVENDTKKVNEKESAIGIRNIPSGVSSQLSGGKALQRLSSSKVQIYYGRIQAVECVKEEIRASVGTVAVVCCGPGPLNDDVRLAVVSTIDKVKSRVDYFEESFSW